MTPATPAFPLFRAGRAITQPVFAALFALFSAATHAADPVELLVKGSSLSDAAWVLKSDNTRQWADPSCRGPLVDAGLAVTYTDWSRIAQYPSGNWDTCAQMTSSVSLSSPSTPGITTRIASVSLLLNGPVTSSQQSAWVLYSDNTKQWIDPSCRVSLQSRGIAENVTNWPNIARYPTGDWLACDAIARLVNGSGSAVVSQGGDRPLLKLVDIAQSEAGPGWVIFADNTKTWVDRNCRRDLENAGINSVSTFWDDVAQHPTGPWRACSDIAALISSPNTGSGTSVATPSTPVLPATRSFGANCMGMNDDFPFSWDGGSIVTDAFKSGRGPLLQDFETESSVDADRWPTGSRTVNFILAEGDHNMEELNPWVLLPYQQSGSWLYGPSLGSWTMDDSSYRGRVSYSGVTGHEFNLGTDTVNLRIYGGNIPSGSRNRWHFVPKSVAASYAAAMRDNNFDYIFNTDKYANDPDFPLIHTQVENQMDGFCRIRYLQGRNTNSLEFSGFESSRTKPSHPTFSTPGGDGMPYEFEVWIANQLGINVFHNDHVKTWDAWRQGDRYLYNEAEFFANNLRGTVIREYANEIWNESYPFRAQTMHVWDNGPYSDPGRTDWLWMNRNYGKRSYDTAGPWVEAFSSRRQDLDNTIAVQVANPPTALERVATPTGVSFSSRIDSISGAFYFGRQIDSTQPLYQTLRRGGLNAVVADHRNDLNKLKADWGQLINITRPYVQKWHLYEGGSHMNFIDYDSNNSSHRFVYGNVESFLNSSTYTSMLTEFGDWWRNQYGSGEMTWFHLNGTDSPREPWGYYRSNTDLTPVHSGAGTFVRNYLGQ